MFSRRPDALLSSSSCLILRIYKVSMSDSTEASPEDLRSLITDSAALTRSFSFCISFVIHFVYSTTSFMSWSSLHSMFYEVFSFLYRPVVPLSHWAKLPPNVEYFSTLFEISRSCDEIMFSYWTLDFANLSFSECKFSFSVFNLAMNSRMIS